MSRAPETLVDLALARSTVDRAGLLRKDETLLARLLKDPDTRVLELVDGTAATLDGAELELRSPEPADAGRLAIFLGTGAATAEPGGADGAGADVAGAEVAGAERGGAAYLAVVAERLSDFSDEGSMGDHRERHGLREVGMRLPARDAGLFTTALALANWHATHTHCPRCGAPTISVEAGWVRRCTSDGTDHYPRTDPAVIMAVVDADDRLLLARAPQWPAGRVSVLAGFVEPGEPLEAAVAREVREEVGIAVTDVRYLGDQPWPFPASLMLGFQATALDTELRPDLDEIAEARWYSRDDLTAAVADGSVILSPSLSIARRLIERWYGGPLGPTG